MMYHYWHTKGIRPSTFYNMPAGEITVIRAFYLKEMEDKAEIMKEYSKHPTACPYMLFNT